ncbi:MAG TPA: AAA family ATPase, partial [Candidatus Limnocylindria bacterium]|nr:AAA family ATPase [Candidatus Limnocylindria bacterium]
MKLARLELLGFKSFPQRTDIRFDGGITGIVGPNGSGKSNIADAVRWVLGEQNARMLRGARMDDVIFAGTQKRRALPWCEVSLVFDNADGALKTPFSEVMVTRKAWRSGESEYMLNRKNCRLKDIAELFYDTGVGGGGYSIIGQGQIDVFLSGRGEERRDALEEAAGISALRTRKEEATRKLDRAQEQLERAGDLLRELEAMLGPLEKQSEAAREYLRLAERLKQVDANVYLVRHERLTRRVGTLTASAEALREALRGHAEEL